MSRFEADTARNRASGGDFACEVIENDGSIDGVVWATAYGSTAEAAEAAGALIATGLELVHADDRVAAPAPTAAMSDLDAEFADDGSQAWIDFRKDRDLSCYTPAALAEALKSENRWGVDWKEEAEACHQVMIGLVDEGYVSEGVINRRMGQENFVEGTKAVNEMFKQTPKG